MRKFDYDVIYHLAALAGVKQCQNEKEDFVFRMNADTCAYIAKNCSPDTLIVYPSSSAIYGEPPSLYALSKQWGEINLLAFHKKSVILRLATIYGGSPFMRNNLLIHDLVRSAVQDGYIVIWNDDTVRPFMTIGDCTRLLMSFAKGKHQEHYGQIVNAFDDSLICSKADVVTMIASLTGCEVFHSKKKDQYPQDIRDYSEYFCYCDAKPLSKETIQPIVEYYER